jgi:outer membrane lipoprotein-sorting protein
VFSSTPPFKTVEPDRYQAIRVILVTTSAGTNQVSKTLIAKDGPLRREELLEPARVVYVYLPQGMFMLAPEARIYAEANTASESTPGATPLDEPEPVLREGGSQTLYRPLGHEDLNGRRLQKYQIVVNSNAVKDVSTFETLVWVDEELGMPVRTEIRSGDNRTVIELTEISRDVDKKLFEIPENYRKVTGEEIRELMKQK